jgi:hypothetical protein
MMFAELSRVMAHARHNDSYLESLGQNVTNKRTSTNQSFTTGFLKKLYGFDPDNQAFKAFKHFWEIADDVEKPVLSLLYALGNDYLLEESNAIVALTPIGEKVSIDKFIENIEMYHPVRFSEKTMLSMAQNLASSWKQAGFITGKVKNIRTQPEITSNTVAFAFLLAYLNGQRGDFILTSKWAKGLCIGEIRLRELAVEASRRGLLQYQFAGHVTSVSFQNLLKILDIHGIEN